MTDNGDMRLFVVFVLDNPERVWLKARAVFAPRALRMGRAIVLVGASGMTSREVGARLGVGAWRSADDSIERAVVAMLTDYWGLPFPAEADR